MSKLEFSAGARLRAALDAERPLQVVGVINAYSALLAQRCGFRAIYLSGAGVANASFGLPDLGITSLNDVAEDCRRITGATPLPLLVDADTGWGGAFNIAHTVRELTRDGAGGLHIEDQVQSKRCGHRPGKALVSAEEMIDRIKAAVDARVDEQFVIMARTDAHAVEGQAAAVERAARYIEAGADMIFGKTPMFTTRELADAGVRLALYPLSAFRASARAALNVYQALRERGTQKDVIDTMQTRAELYDVLGYHDYESKLDELFGRNAAGD
jgi:methylisocitrate lyase